MNQQTVIPHAGLNEQTLSSFYVGENGDLLLQIKEAVAGTRADPMLYLWGERGSGKTHLLNACCDLAIANDRPYRYLSLEDFSQLNGMFGKMSSSLLVCLDNLHLAETDSGIEIKLLTLYEQVKSCNGHLIAAGLMPLNEIRFGLPDLVSRLSSGGSFRLVPLCDSDKRKALEQRASLRGFSLEPAVLDFIMTHFDRDTTSLFSLLDRIDSASLSSHRRVTIPFLKDFLRSD